MVTIAVRLPAAEGRVEKVTVSEVAVATVTVPTAPLLSTTVLFAGVVSKPNPAIATVVALAASKLAAFIVTTGITVATCTPAPLVKESVVTDAVKLPAVVGVVLNDTINSVGVAEVTMPTAPLLKVTELSPTVVSNPKPVIVTDEAFAAKFDVALVTTGVTVAICTAEPLLMLFEVTIAVRLPADDGFAEKVTVSVVAVAAVTEPVAPLFKITVLLPGVVSKPKPLMVTVLAFAAKFVVALVMTGATFAI